jgi:hypothetical protein
VLGSGPGDIAIDSGLNRDSVVQFMAACEGADFSLTSSNIFDFELLCDEWSVGKSIRKKAAEFIEYLPDGQSLWLRRLLFRLGRGLSTSEAEDVLRSNLVGLVSDSAALEIPVAILSRIVDFRCYEDNQEEYKRMFTFCVDYLRVHGSSASEIMRSLDVTRLSNEDLGGLCTVEQLNWGVLNESVCQCLIELRGELLASRQQNEQHRREIKNLQNLVERQGREIGDLGKEFAREQSEKAGLEATIKAQERKIGELEGENRHHEETILTQASEIEGLKTAKNKCEDELKGSIKATDAQRQELMQLKDEMQVKQDRLLKELAERKDELNKFGRFPPSMKRGTAENGMEYDIPDGILVHLKQKRGGNLCGRNVVGVTMSQAYGGNPKDIADPETTLECMSYWGGGDGPGTRNNWVCFDFKDRRIVPTHYGIRTMGGGPGSYHLKSWLVETSVDGKVWREVDHRENNDQLNGTWFTAIFAVTGGEICRFIRLVNLGKNHWGNTALYIQALEIFGSLVE